MDSLAKSMVFVCYYILSYISRGSSIQIAKCSTTHRLPKIGRRLWTKGVLRCIRANDTVFKKCKIDHALNLSQLQTPTLTLNHITRLGMPRGIPSLTGGFSKPEHRFQLVCGENMSSGHGTNLENTTRSSISDYLHR